MTLFNTVLFNSLPDPFLTPALAPSGQNMGHGMGWDMDYFTPHSSLWRIPEVLLSTTREPSLNNYKDLLASPTSHSKSLSFTWLPPTYAQHCVGHQGAIQRRKKKKKKKNPQNNQSKEHRPSLSLLISPDTRLHNQIFENPFSTA